MSKVIIPRVQLPGVSEESINKLRYRIVNRNRNLYSQYSVIGEIKRERDETDFSDNPTSFTADNSISNLVNLAWYSSDINQEFDVYLRYKFRVFNLIEFVYFYDNLQFLGRKDTNSLLIAKKPPPTDRVFAGGNVPSSYSVQAMVKLPEYPRIFAVPVSILSFERSSDDFIYYLNKDPNFSAGDYVNINLNNSPSEDNSDFAGIKLVKSIGAKSFTVESSGADISERNSYNIDPSLPNNAQKMNGIIQFVTDDILFT